MLSGVFCFGNAGEYPDLAKPVLNAPTLRRAATVMRHRGHVCDGGNFKAKIVECTHRGITARARALDLHIQLLHSRLLRCPSCGLGSDLGRKRRALTTTPEPGAPRRRPGHSIPVAVGDGDDRIVEGCVHVRYPFGDVLLNLCFCTFLVLDLCHAINTCPYLRIGRLGPLRVRAFVEVR
jgi:hypothetical protein